MKHMTKRHLIGATLGVALLLGIAVDGSAQQDGSVASVPGETPTITEYRLSAPNELDTEGNGSGVPAPSRPYRLSAPNELDPQDSSSSGLSQTYPFPYRLSPPNEADPTGP